MTGNHFADVREHIANAERKLAADRERFEQAQRQQRHIEQQIKTLIAHLCQQHGAMLARLFFGPLP